MPVAPRSLRTNFFTRYLAVGVSIISPGAMAVDQSLKIVVPGMQIGRYSELQPSPNPGQRDLLAVIAPLRVPEEISTVGGALRWVLQDSGYRLAAPERLANDVTTMLNLPLPRVHRQFQPLPLKDVIALLVGPAFVLVRDPVNRLLAFEHCRDGAPQEKSTKHRQVNK